MKIRSCKRMGRSRIARCGLPVFKLSEVSITPASFEGGRNPSHTDVPTGPPALSVTFKTSTVLYKGDTIKLTISGLRFTGAPVGHHLHSIVYPFFRYPVVKLISNFEHSPAGQPAGQPVGFNIMNPRNRNTSIAAPDNGTGNINNFGGKNIRIVIGRDPFQSVFKQEKYNKFLYMKTLNQRIPGRITEGPNVDSSLNFLGYLGINGPAPHYSRWNVEVPLSALPNQENKNIVAKAQLFTHQPDSETAITFVVDQEFIKKDTNIYILMGPDSDSQIILNNGDAGTVYKWGLNVSRHKEEKNMHAWTTTV